jgi:hypothetical protein
MIYYNHIVYFFLNEMKDLYVGNKLFIYILLNISCKIFFIYKSCAWKKNSGKLSSKYNSI